MAQQSNPQCTTTTAPIHDTPQGITVRRLAKDFLHTLGDRNANPDAELEIREIVSLAREFAFDVSAAIHGKLTIEYGIHGPVHDTPSSLVSLMANQGIKTGDDLSKYIGYQAERERVKLSRAIESLSNRIVDLEKGSA